MPHHPNLETLVSVVICETDSHDVRLLARRCFRLLTQTAAFRLDIFLHFHSSVKDRRTRTW